MKTEINSGMKTTEMLTCNIAKSGEVHNWSAFTPFKLHLGLIVNRSQSASCHIAKRYGKVKNKKLNYRRSARANGLTTQSDRKFLLFNHQSGDQKPHKKRGDTEKPYE